MEVKRRAGWICLCLVLVLMTGMLGGCREHSEYPEATVSVPDTYAGYDVDPMHFRFEAGWTSANFDSVQVQMDDMVLTLGINNNICIFYRLKSPVYDQGTVNYLDFGYLQMNHTMKAEDLEGIMEQLDTLQSSIKRMELSSTQLQASRIRCYGKNELEALTFCYKISTSINDYTISCVEQVALIPWGTRLYVLIYSDFTTGGDSPALEEVLSTLTIDQP